MKKVITILMILALCLALVCVASAEEMEKSGQPSVVSGQKKEEVEKEKDELRVYIEEKIVPILMGVATSIVALLGTLKGILSALKELKKGRDDFKETSKQIKQSTESDSKMLRADYSAIKDSVKDVPELLGVIKRQDEKIEELKGIVVVATEILSLAYSANSELVRTGKAKEMNRLLNKLGTKGVSDSETV